MRKTTTYKKGDKLRIIGPGILDTLHQEIPGGSSVTCIKEVSHGWNTFVVVFYLGNRVALVPSYNVQSEDYLA